MIDLRMVIKSNDKTVLQWRKWQVVHDNGFGKSDWGEWENVPMVVLSDDGVVDTEKEINRLKSMIGVP